MRFKLFIISTLSLLLPVFKKYTFAFLVHPRDIKDIDSYIPLSRFIPYWFKEKISYYLWPVAVSEITGLKNKAGKDIVGCIIACPMTAGQLMNHRDRARSKIIKAAKLAKSLGVNMVGLGALLSSLSRGGLDITEKVKSVGVTTGHGLTVYIVTQHVLKAVKVLDIDLSKCVIAVVGAAGSIGSGSIKILIKNNFKEVILFDVERKNDELMELKIKLLSINSKNNITSSNQMNDLKRADIIITATNAPDTLVRSRHLKPGVVIIDDAQPTDIDEEIFKSRDDVLVLEGGVVNTPNIDCHYNLGLKQKGDIFSCLGEVLVLAYLGYQNNYNVGKLDQNKIELIKETASKLNFLPGEFQNYYKLYSQEDIIKIKNIIKNEK